jgi:hypothetical protein
MSAQTTYTINHAAALDGMLADLADKDVVSRSVETAAGVEFGRVVSFGTDPEKQVVLGGDATGIGVAVRSADHENAIGSDNVKYARYETAAILRKGYVWCKFSNTGSAGNAICYTDADGVLKSGAASTGETDLVGTLETDVATIGDLGLIRLGM